MNFLRSSFLNLADIKRNVITAPKSKAPGILKRLAMEKNKPIAINLAFVKFLFRRSINPAIIGPIRNNSAFAIFPSRIGRVVRTAKIHVEVI